MAKRRKHSQHIIRYSPCKKIFVFYVYNHPFKYFIIIWALWVVGCGLWVVGCGLWVVGCGLWVVGCGLWVVGCGLWVVGCGLWVVGCGLWVVGCGLWVVGCGLWIVDCGLPFNELYIWISRNSVMTLVLNMLCLTSTSIHIGICSLYWTSLTEVKIDLWS